MTGADLLFDPIRLSADDRHALLPAAAAAGAQVRATADQLRTLGPIARPRSVVVIGARAATTAALVSACAPGAPAPILGLSRLPGWIGPLDVVIVLAADAEDAEATRAADIAGRRGATVVVRAAATGPVAAAAPGGPLVPGVGVPEALAEPGRTGLVAGVAAAAGLLPDPDWAAVADLLDVVALGCRPHAEAFVNPALGLASVLSSGAPLLVGADPVADAVTAHAQQVLQDVAGVPVGRLSSALAMGNPVVLRRASGARDLFADPDESPRVGLVLVSAPDLAGADFDLSVARALRQSLPTAFPVSTDDLGREAQQSLGEFGLPLPGPTAVDPGAPTVPAGPKPLDPLACVLGLVSRFDFAAVYLALTLGALPLFDGPDGLARRGSARIGVRPAVVDPSPARDSDDDW